MPRVDDYKKARELAVEYLKNLSLEEIKRRSLFESKDDSTLLISFLGDNYELSYPDFKFKNVSNPEKPLSLIEEVLIFHYLKALPLLDEHFKWISFREIPGTGFYYSAFTKRAIDPLRKVFGRNVQGFKDVSELLRGKTLDVGDASFEYWVFPRVPIRIILWEGDEEFEPEANILFRSSIDKILSPEDIVWTASLLVYKLIGLVRNFQK